MTTTESVHAAAYAALCECDPVRKRARVDSLQHQWRKKLLSQSDTTAVVRIDNPGRPEKPQLVVPQGYAVFVHALCHIEFNAINIALDAAYRFRDLPEAFYTDWLNVAAEEAYHFSLLRQHLQTLEYDYGDFPAHNSLWELTVVTDDDPLTRMALVPRVQEAHGLDVTPGLITKLKAKGHDVIIPILEIILRDEISHVLVGNRWFNYLCVQRNLEPLVTFQQLLLQKYRGKLHGPFDLAIRKQAGFSDAELDYFQEVG
jgi:uncharacterized ferritin-like protein (DUF455 family)